MPILPAAVRLRRLTSCLAFFFAIPRFAQAIVEDPVANGQMRIETTDATSDTVDPTHSKESPDSVSPPLDPEAPRNVGPVPGARADAKPIGAEQSPLARDTGYAEDPPTECDLMPIWGVRAGCRTPREGTLSGGFMALDLGVLSFEPQAADRAGIGLGFAGQVRFGVEFWDQLITSFSLGTYVMDDQRPFSQEVVECDKLGDVVYDCGEPYSTKSDVTALFVSPEIGYQSRFRPSLKYSLTPGVMLGYLHSFGGLKRQIKCEGCRSEDLGDSSGGYLAPFLRVTFDRLGYFALSVRSQWFFGADLQQATFIGGEMGLP